MYFNVGQILFLVSYIFIYINYNHEKKITEPYIHL